MKFQKLLKNKNKNKNSEIKKVFFLLFVVLTMGGCSRENKQHQVSSDNSQKNERDIQGGPLTPESQSNSQQDLDITQQIRQAVISDPSLSTNAKNIKIITLNRVVTLRGPVDTQNEKENVFNKARQIVGSENVINQIEIVTH